MSKNSLPKQPPVFEKNGRHYIATDDVFSVVKPDGERYQDVVDPGTQPSGVDADRLILTRTRDEAAEASIAAKLGPGVLLPFIGEAGGLNMYACPVGTQPLSRFLEYAAFDHATKDRLAQERDRWLEVMRALDPFGFGLNAEDAVIIPAAVGHPGLYQVAFLPPLPMQEISPQEAP